MLLLAGCADNNWLVAGRLSTCVPHGRQFNTEPSVIQGQPPHPAGFSAAAEQLSTLQLWSADWGLGRRRKIKTLESTEWREISLTGTQLPRPFFVQTTLGGLATVHLVSVSQLRRRRQRRRKCRRSIGDNLACAVASLLGISVWEV